MLETLAFVKELPRCSFCNRPAMYDFKTIIDGKWAYGCAGHWRIYRMYDKLGVGKGQELTTSR